MAMSLAETRATLTASGAPFEMIECEVDGRPLRCWKHVPPTIRALAETLPRWSARDYLVYEDERLSYGEAHARICALARWLVDQAGIRKGDRVAVAMRNLPEWVLSFFAAASAGAIVVPLNGWWTGDELAYGLRDSGTRVLFADAERAERVVPRLEALPLEHLVVARAHGSLPEQGMAFESLVARVDADPSLPDVDLEPNDDATIFYTSGTTGDPKGALGTHRNMMTNVGSSHYVRAWATLRRGDPLPDPERQPQPTVLISVPLFHVTGSHSFFAASTALGAKIVTMRKWNPERALELIERERVQRFGGVPAMAWQVLESPDFSKRDTSSVTAVGYGGAPSAPDLVRRIQSAFPTASPSNGYGLTETSALATSNAGVDYVRKPDSCGPLLPICDSKVVDEEGRELDPGMLGELWIRGPNVVKGYWQKPEATAASFVDGWLRTGDLVRIDEEGFVTIFDRAKDMLIRGGENVYCVEVENVLYDHPDVIDAAVVGIPHRVLGEEVGAVVQVARGATLTADALRSWAAERLAAFKVPVHVELRDAPLPRNANGKILKRQLVDGLDLSQG